MAFLPVRTAALLAAAVLQLSSWAKSPEDFVPPEPKSASKSASAPQAAAPAPKPAATQAPAPAPAGKTPQPAATAKPAAAASAAKPAGPAPAPAPAAKAAAPAKASASRPVLDTAHIHSIYLDGDFDQAIRLLDGALKGKKPLTHNDSVFIYKHLGVIYAASPSTREKGRYYMLQLISIEPTAKILDMYASDMIYLIFRNVQEEFENKYGRSVAKAPAVDTVPAPAPVAEAPKDTLPARTAASGSRHGKAYWIAGGAAVTAGVVGLVYILLDDPKPKKHNIVLEE